MADHNKAPQESEQELEQQPNSVNIDPSKQEAVDQSADFSKEEKYPPSSSANADLALPCKSLAPNAGHLTAQPDAEPVLSLKKEFPAKQHQEELPSQAKNAPLPKPIQKEFSRRQNEVPTKQTDKQNEQQQKGIPLPNSDDVPLARPTLPKPTRPLTAYHMFFQLEREWIIQSTSSSNEEDNQKVLNDMRPIGKEIDNDMPFRYRYIHLNLNWFKSGSGKRLTAGVGSIVGSHGQDNSNPPPQVIPAPAPLPKRKHRKTHGKISFLELSRRIAARWAELQEIDPTTKEYVGKIAKRELELYKKEMKWYKAHVGGHASAASNSSVASTAPAPIVSDSSSTATVTSNSSNTATAAYKESAAAKLSVRSPLPARTVSESTAITASSLNSAIAPIATKSSAISKEVVGTSNTDAVAPAPSTPLMQEPKVIKCFSKTSNFHPASMNLVTPNSSSSEVSLNSTAKQWGSGNTPAKEMTHEVNQQMAEPAHQQIHSTHNSETENMQWTNNCNDDAPVEFSFYPVPSSQVPSFSDFADSSRKRTWSSRNYSQGHDDGCHDERRHKSKRLDIRSISPLPHLPFQVHRDPMMEEECNFDMQGNPSRFVGECKAENCFSGCYGNDCNSNYPSERHCNTRRDFNNNYESRSYSNARNFEYRREERAHDCFNRGSRHSMDLERDIRSFLSKINRDAIARCESAGYDRYRVSHDEMEQRQRAIRNRNFNVPLPCASPFSPRSNSDGLDCSGNRSVDGIRTHGIDDRGEVASYNNCYTNCVDSVDPVVSMLSHVLTTDDAEELMKTLSEDADE